MFNVSNSLFFFYFSTVIYVSDSATFLNSSVKNEDNAAEALVEIEPDQALPLVLFRESITHISSQPTFDELALPKELIQVETVKRRMAKGTEFSNLSDTQTFFCPQQDSEEKCLAPKDFGESEYLECAKPPIPVVSSVSENDCGFEESGTFHDIGYDICTLEKSHNYEYETKRIPFYGFCFNESEKTTIFTSHIIPSPSLLKSHLLLRERSVNYSIALDDEFRPLNWNKINAVAIQRWDSITHLEKPSYKLQMLVPDANMALALWRKTTYRNFNLEWQHEELVPFWNEINRLIRSYAQQSPFLRKNKKIKVHTGVININPASEDKTQMLNVWISMIITMPPNGNRNSKGVVIFMNNFIRNVTDNSSTISKETEEAIDQYCQDDFCDDKLQKRINEAGSRLRCCGLCSLSKDKKEVRNVFGVIPDLDTENDIPKLKIPGLTKGRRISDLTDAERIPWL